MISSGANWPAVDLRIDQKTDQRNNTIFIFLLSVLFCCLFFNVVVAAFQPK